LQEPYLVTCHIISLNVGISVRLSAIMRRITSAISVGLKSTVK
jgi:hypothetical protein